MMKERNKAMSLYTLDGSKISWKGGIGTVEASDFNDTDWNIINNKIMIYSPKSKRTLVFEVYKTMYHFDGYDNLETIGWKLVCTEPGYTNLTVTIFND